MPPKFTEYKTRADYEAALKEYRDMLYMQRLNREAAFPQVLPEKTPEQMKIDRVYGEGFQPPYDDDAPTPKKKSAMQGMRFIKENQDGTGRADNKGLMALGRSGPKGREAYKNITGKEFKEAKEAGMGIKYGMGTGMADEKMMEYGRKMMEHGEKLMAMGAKMEPSLDPEPGVSEMTMGEKMYQNGTG